MSPRSRLPSPAAGPVRLAGTAALATWCLVGGSAVPARATPVSAAEEVPSAPGRVIVLGFDGVDPAKSREFMDAGHLPNLAALAESGSFLPLGTTNPAESAVSWSTFGTGLNPGRTGVIGFVIRPEGKYFPDLGFMKSEKVPIGRFYSMAPERLWPWTLGAAGALFVAGLALGLVFRAKAGLAAILGLAAGAAGGGAVYARIAKMPRFVNAPKQVRQGETLWARADRAGKVVRGVQVPMSCPVEEMEHGFVQGGLGIPDITGSIGAWYILSSSTADVPVGEKKKTNSGGWVLRLREENGVFSCEIPGPDDLARKEEVSDRLAAIESKLKDFDVAPETKSKLREERDRLKAEQKKGFAVTVPIEIRRRDGDEALEISLDGTTQTVKDGSWSGWFRLTFPLPAPLELPAVVRLRVLRTKDWIRVFVPPLGYDPEDPPPYAAMSSPIEYSGELARAVGNYETVGWACWQNPLKDLEFGEDAFLENIRMLTEWRKKMVLHELCRDDWDLFLGVFGETDRVQHMMWRLIDPSSPTYDEALAAKYGSAILDVYKAMDEIVGDVMRSHVDDRTTLVVLSDHGFQPFNRQVNLNTWLVEQGYLVPTSGGGDPKNVVATVPEERHDYLLFMDQERSRAFALGLGKIYLNLAGREPKGIVTKEEYPGLCEEIRRKLLALRDPKDGRRVVDRVFLRDEIYQGPYARSDADLFLGFAKGYRIGWKTTSGGIAAETIEDNPQKWSGDHVSVDPLHVPGILVSNRRFDPASNPDMTDIAPTVLALLGLPAEGMDGSPIAER